VCHEGLGATNSWDAMQFAGFVCRAIEAIHRAKARVLGNAPLLDGSQCASAGSFDRFSWFSSVFRQVARAIMQPSQPNLYQN
jgi:hypothetical protein